MQLYKRGKTWTYRIRYRDEHSKMKSVSKSGFRIKSKAETVGLEVQKKYKESGISSNKNTTFYDYYMAWINTYKLGRLDLTTERKYKIIGKLIDKKFGDTLLKNISRMEYQQMLDEYAKSHAKSTVNEINGRVRKVVQGAIAERIIYSDFTRNVIVSGKAGKSKDLKFIEEDEAKKLKNICLENCSVKTITNNEIVFGLLTGCRIGEVTGLTWNCVDFKNKTVNINKSYDYVSKTGFKSTKTVSSVRVITIPDEFNDVKKTSYRAT